MPRRLRQVPGWVKEPLAGRVFRWGFRGVPVGFGKARLPGFRGAGALPGRPFPSWKARAGPRPSLHAGGGRDTAHFPPPAFPRGPLRGAFSCCGTRGIP